jgi:hypothetical protein
MPGRHSNRYLWLAIAGAGLVIAAYIYLYVGQPLEEPWNTNLGTLLISLAAISSAVAAALNWRRFSPADRGPRGVWGYLALGLWLWAIGETVYAGYFFLGTEVPLLSAADIFWMLGYIGFAGALIHQYRVVYRPARRQEVGITLGVVGGIFVVSLIITALIQQSASTKESWLATLVTVLYPLLDLAVGLAALWLVYAFGGGLWSRPWLGLFVFALADSFYAWLELTGIYEASVVAGNPLSLVADVMYIAAYLVVAVACVSHLLLLQFGPPPAAAPDPDSLA